MQARLNKIWPTRKNWNSLLKDLLYGFQKTQDFLPFFQDFTSIFQTFPRSGKLLGKFQDFFKNSRLCTNPAVFKLDTVIHNSTSAKIRLHLTELSEAT